MTSNKNILIVAAGAIAYFLYRKTKATELITYNISSVALNFDGITPVLRVIMKIQNITSQSLLLNSMVGNLYIDNTNVGSVSNFTETLIAPNAESDYSIFVKLNLLGVVSDLISLITNHTGAAKMLTITAAANVEGLIFPINASYQIN